MHLLKTLKGSTATIQQTKIDATDRRQIEAQNEDKSRTTKETLDDIKRIHQKEKKKQEENNMNMYHPGTTSEGGVIKIFICQKYAFNIFLFLNRVFEFQMYILYFYITSLPLVLAQEMRIRLLGTQT